MHLHLLEDDVDRQFLEFHYLDVPEDFWILVKLHFFRIQMFALRVNCLCKSKMLLCKYGITTWTFLLLSIPGFLPLTDVVDRKMRRHVCTATSSYFFTPFIIYTHLCGPRHPSILDLPSTDHGTKYFLSWKHRFVIVFPELRFLSCLPLLVPRFHTKAHGVMRIRNSSKTCS